MATPTLQAPTEQAPNPADKACSRAGTSTAANANASTRGRYRYRSQRSRRYRPPSLHMPWMTCRGQPWTLMDTGRQDELRNLLRSSVCSHSRICRRSSTGLLPQHYAEWGQRSDGRCKTCPCSSQCIQRPPLGCTAPRAQGWKNSSRIPGPMRPRKGLSPIRWQRSKCGSIFTAGSQQAEDEPGGQ